jgi:hypothetical protein
MVGHWEWVYDRLFLIEQGLPRSVLKKKSVLRIIKAAYFFDMLQAHACFVTNT